MNKTVMLLDSATILLSITNILIKAAGASGRRVKPATADELRSRKRRAAPSFLGLLRGEIRAADFWGGLNIIKPVVG